MSSTGFDRRLPCEQFYWAIVKPSPAAATRRDNQRAIAYQFEESLPLPLESVQVATQKLPEGRVLACAMDRDRLGSLASGLLSLGPTSVPGHLDASIDPCSINLLVGEFEPTELRQPRRRTARLVALALVALAAILTIGLERRAAILRRHHRETSLRSNALMESVVGPSGKDAQPALVRFTSELRALRQSNAAVRLQTPRDAAVSFANVLAMVRHGERAEPRVESLIAADDSLQLTAALPTHELAQRWIALASNVEGWSLAQPQVAAASGAVRVALRWSPIEPVVGPGKGPR